VERPSRKSGFYAAPPRVHRGSPDANSHRRPNAALLKRVAYALIEAQDNLVLNRPTALVRVLNSLQLGWQ
jgi:hypothetical protein